LIEEPQGDVRVGVGDRGPLPLEEGGAVGESILEPGCLRLHCPAMIPEAAFIASRSNDGP
jgi:hypothetical protein